MMGMARNGRKVGEVVQFSQIKWSLWSLLFISKLFTMVLGG
jgi:hypothetical protein